MFALLFCKTIDFNLNITIIIREAKPFIYGKYKRKPRSMAIVKCSSATNNSLTFFSVECQGHGLP